MKYHELGLVEIQNEAEIQNFFLFQKLELEK
jgi:hypothetical protein